MFSLKNHSHTLPAYSKQAISENIPSRVEKLFSTLELQEESRLTHKISEQIFQSKDLEKGLKIIERTNRISPKILAKLLKKKGHDTDLVYIFKHILDIDKNSNHATYYVSLLRNFFEKGAFDFAEALLIQAEDRRVVDAYFYSKFISMATSKKAFEIAEKGFDRFRCYYELDLYSPSCNFEALTHDMQRVYQDYTSSLMTSQQWTNLQQLCKQLERNWKTPPAWLDQVKKNVYEISLKEFKQAQSEKGQQNYPKAIAHFEKAAALGMKEAMYELAICFQNGLGVPKQSSKAVEWLKLAAGKGLATALYALGIHYQKGIGVAVDPSAAFKCYTKAAEQHNLKSALALSYCYICGCGTAVDLLQARHLLARAEENPQIKQTAFYIQVSELLEKAENQEICGASKKRAGSLLQSPEPKKFKATPASTDHPSKNSALVHCYPEGRLEDFFASMDFDMNKSAEENENMLAAIESLKSTLP